MRQMHQAEVNDNDNEWQLGLTAVADQPNDN